MRLILLSGLLCLAAHWGAADVVLKMNVSSANQADVRVLENGEVEIRTTGGDPYVFLEPFAFDQLVTGESVLAFELFCPDGIGELEVFYGPPIQAGRSVATSEGLKSESWIQSSINLGQLSAGRWTPESNHLRMDFGRKAGVLIRMRDLRLRAPNDRERMAAEEVAQIRRKKQAQADAITSYLKEKRPAAISAVSVNEDEIVIDGRIERGGNQKSILLEVPMWVGPWERVLAREQVGSEPVPISAAGGEFRSVVPRFVDGRDRFGARWAVAEVDGDGEFALKSHFAYATDLVRSAKAPVEPIEMPSSRKGMGGVWANDILDELVELGVRHVTANMAITSLLSAEARAGWSTFKHAGRIWWVNPRVVDGHDRLIRFATQNGIVVSAIILVPFGEGEFSENLIHPEADRAGHYAMPNFTTEAGVGTYEAAIAFLAERYAQPGDPHGRITNWILHNEVDYGWEWTNMGRQPMEIFLETYIRSMRLVHFQARRFNPQARVFISLTHNWNVEEDLGWKTYSPKRMLEQLATYSRVEGDFEWGVAYHPYPQSLFKPDAWNDTLPTDSFDTPMITPKNIAVLDRWMRRPEMLFRGEKVRGVLLSEQGFHTDGYSEAALRLQGEAFVYMWEQMEGLESIEVFHNHRWIDHPAEGGLKLGIRTLPSAEHPYGERKPAWDVFKRLETKVDKESADRPWKR